MMANIFVIIISFYFFINTINNQQISINQSLKIWLSEQNNYSKIISFNTSQQLNNNLAIQIQSTNPTLLNQITILFQNKQQKINKKCKGIKYVTCVLHSIQIKNKEVVSFAIKSNEEGEYSVVVRQIKYEELEQKSMNINFINGSMRYYKASLQRYGDKIENVRFVLIPKLADCYGHIYAQIQTNISQIHESIGMWKGAEGLFLSKKLINNSKFIYFWVIGEQNKVYTIDYQIMSKDHHDLQIPQHFFQFIDNHASKIYHIKCENMTDNEQYIINIKIYSGNPEIQFYSSQNISIHKSFLSQFYQYMGDVKFIFKKVELNGSNNLYFKVKSGQHNSIYQIQVDNRSQDIPELLAENSYNFQSITKQKYLYLYLYQNQQYIQSYINISISVLYFVGKSKVKVFVGSSQGLDCLPGCQGRKFKEIRDVKFEVVAIKQVMGVRISTKEVNQSSILLIKLQHNSDTNKSQQLSIQYSFEGRIIDIRENYPLTEMVEIGQTKYYRYTPLQISKQLKICLSIISGDVKIFGSYKNPMLSQNNSSQHNSLTQLKNCLHFDKKTMQKSVYIWVFGELRSKYSISVQVQHGKLQTITPILQTNQDVDYQVIILPQSQYIFVLHPIYSYLRVFFNSSLPVDVCFVELLSSQCVVSSVRKMQVSGQLSDIQNAKMLYKKIKIINPSVSDKVTFRLKYHSGSYEHCQQRLMSKVYQQDISKNSCFQYEVSLSGNNQRKCQVLAKKVDYWGVVQLSVGVCGNEIIQKSRQRVIGFTESQIIKHCKGKEPTLQLILNLTKSPERPFRYQYIVQCQAEVIKLAPNIKYTDIASITESDPLRQFTLSSQIQSDVILSIKQVSTFMVSLSVKVFIVDPLAFNAQTYQKLSPFLTKNMGTEFQIDITLLPNTTKSNCQQIPSKQCNILVIIEPSQRVKIGETISYMIQFKSANRQLKQYQPQISILDEIGDQDLYSFYPKIKQEGEGKYKGIVQISTHNEQCAQLRINLYNKPQKNQSINHGNSSITQFNISSTAYLIQVLANAPNCRYSIQILSIKSTQNSPMLSVLHPEIQHDIILSQKQLRYFIVDVPNYQNIKVIYIQRYGNIYMYANEFDIKLQQNIIKNQGYQFKADDFEIKQKFPNLIDLPGSKNYGGYLVAIYGKSQTQGTLLVHRKHFPLVLPHWKKIVYKLEEKEDVSFRFYTPKDLLKSGKIIVNLIYGKINISAALLFDQNLSKRQQIKITSDICCSLTQTNKIVFSSNGTHPKYLEVRISNPSLIELDISIFEISIQLDSNTFSTQDIDKNSLSDIMLIRGQTTVIKSTLFSKHHQIIISIPQKKNNTHNKQITQQNQSQSSSLLKCLTAKIPQKSKGIAQLSKIQLIMDNILLLTIQWQKYIYKQSFQLLLQLSLTDICVLDNIQVSIISNVKDKLSVLLPFQWMYVTSTRYFAIAGKSQYLIDVISCKGEVKINTANTLQNLHNINNNTIELPHYIKNQTHVIRIIPNSSINYIKIQASQTVMRYIQPNLQKDIGIGYIKYQWDYFKYETDYQKLTIILQPIKNITITNGKFMRSIYTVRVFQGFDMRNNYVQCQDQGKKIIYKIIIKNHQQKSYTFSIPKQKLLKTKDKKLQNIYLSIDMYLVLVTPDGKQQNYRFYSPIQKIPIDLFNISKLNNKIMMFGIGMIIMVMICCVGFAVCFIKYFVPFVSRINRNDHFVEEDAGSDGNKDNVPPSSQRNKRIFTEIGMENIQTQCKMKL